MRLNAVESPAGQVEGGTPVSTLTIPEAKAQLSTATPPFIVLATQIIAHIREGERPPADDASISVAATLIRAADTYAEAIAGATSDTQANYHEETVMVTALRRLGFEVMLDINPDQAWFWTEEWQAGERAVDRDIATGNLGEPETEEEFLAGLDAVIARRA
jgi:hypothetical protein